MKWIELLRKDNYALLQSESDTQYAVVSGYDPAQPENQQWSHGTYFTYWNNAKRKADCLQNALDCFRSRTEIKYVTSISSKSKVAKWEDGQNAMTFSKAYAKDLAWGLTLNGNPAIAMLKESYLHLENPKIESE